MLLTSFIFLFKVGMSLKQRKLEDSSHSVDYLQGNSKLVLHPLWFQLPQQQSQAKVPVLGITTLKANIAET